MDDELHDPELARSLGRVAGGTPDVDAAFSTMLRGARAARRRRTVTWIASGAAVVVLFGAAAFALPGGDEGGRLVPSESTTDGSSPPSLSTATTIEGSVVTTGTSVRSVTSGTAAAQTSVPASSIQPNGAPAATSGTSPTSGSTSATSTSKTCSTSGGSVTVRRSGSNLVIVATNPAGGWSVHESEAEGDRVKVTFEREDGDKWKIEARWTGSAITCSTELDGDSSGSGSDDSGDD